MSKGRKTELIPNQNNYTVHGSLGDKPSAITKAKEGESRLQQYLFKIGQTVCISHVRSLSGREYSQKWTGELLKIHTRFRREGVSVYTLVDCDKERVEGTFYEPEIQAVNVDETTEFRIKKILKRRTKNKRKEVLVRWLHWPKKYDSWIPEEDVKDYS